MRHFFVLLHFTVSIPFLLRSQTLTFLSLDYLTCFLNLKSMSILKFVQQFLLLFLNQSLSNQHLQSLCILYSCHFSTTPHPVLWYWEIMLSPSIISSFSIASNISFLTSLSRALLADSSLLPHHTKGLLFASLETPTLPCTFQQVFPAFSEVVWVFIPCKHDKGLPHCYPLLARLTQRNL